jgi:hypothetical protein
MLCNLCYITTTNLLFFLTVQYQIIKVQPQAMAQANGFGFSKNQARLFLAWSGLASGLRLELAHH